MQEFDSNVEAFRIVDPHGTGYMDGQSLARLVLQLPGIGYVSPSNKGMGLGKPGVSCATYASLGKSENGLGRPWIDEDDMKAIMAVADPDQDGRISLKV
eukprot:1154255-Pelagomonas_calceolata.AAC.7